MSYESRPKAILMLFMSNTVVSYKNLFKPFSQIINSGKIKEGSGLGLHLSKKLANLPGGDILVKSIFGRGSTFKLVITLK